MICATLVALLCTTGAAHAESVRVRVFSLHPPRVVEVRFVAPGTIRMDGARRKVPAGERIRVEAAARAVITVVAPRFEMRADGGPWKGFAGAATIRAPSGLYLVAEIPLEEYVAGVVDAEALPGCPPAALHAQAVAARSFAVALAARDGGPHAREGYAFCDLTHCQSFRGVPSGGRGVAAALATRGVLLRRAGRVIPAWYASTCGGVTADPRSVFGIADGALGSVPDGPPGARWCRRSPHFRWRVRVPAERLRAALNADEQTAPGNVLARLEVLDRAADGRATRIRIDGQHRRVAPGYDVWLVLGRTLGWGQIESPWLWIARDGGDFVFHGNGLGHGVGMCQWGAAEMARAGRNMPEILRNYYPGARLYRR